MTNFKYWTRDKLRKTFGLKRIYNSSFLQNWFENLPELDDYEKVSLERLLDNMQKFVDYWNEDEVKLKFIGNIISLVNFDTETISAFANREISGIVDEEELLGKPDVMVATGKQEVDAPFFFLQSPLFIPPKGENKENSLLWGDARGATPDPAGQCLVAMLLAYEKNKEVPQMKNKPIYGVYVIGRNWFFMVLKDREYAISLAYDATHKDKLLDILRIMKAQRAKIREIWGE